MANVPQIGQLSDVPGRGTVGYSGFHSPFEVAVRNLFSTTGGFATTFFTAAYGKRPHAVARGTIDGGTSIADHTKINILEAEGKGGLATAIFEWYVDAGSLASPTLRTISSNPPKGIMYGWYPSTTNRRSQDSLKRLGTLTTGIAEPTSPSNGGTAYVTNGVWVPLELADGTGGVEGTFDVTTNLFKRDSGGNGTAQVVCQSAPLKWLLRGAKAVMFLPTGSTAAPTFDSAVTDAQVIVGFGS